MKTLLLLSALLVPLALAGKAPPPPILNGDANLDGQVCMSDSVLIIYHLWRDGRELPCVDAADVDRSGDIGVADVIGGLRYIFFGDAIPDCPISCPSDFSTTDGYYPE